MKPFLFIVVVRLLLPPALAAPTDSEEMVLTPGGLRPKSRIHAIPDGGLINILGNEIQLLLQLLQFGYRRTSMT